VTHVISQDLAPIPAPNESSTIKTQPCTPFVHQPGLISGCSRMLLVRVFGLSKGFCNNHQHPETRRFFLVMSRSAVRVRSSALKKR
jgi:hypothetical protein